jgi:hypothetical protein
MYLKDLQQVQHLQLILLPGLQQVDFQVGVVEDMESVQDSQLIPTQDRSQITLPQHFLQLSVLSFSRRLDLLKVTSALLILRTLQALQPNQIQYLSEPSKVL